MQDRDGPDRAFTVGFDRELQTGQHHDIRLIGLDQLYANLGLSAHHGIRYPDSQNGTTLHQPARIPEVGCFLPKSLPNEAVQRGLVS